MAVALSVSAQAVDVSLEYKDGKVFSLVTNETSVPRTVSYSVMLNGKESQNVEVKVQGNRILRSHLGAAGAGSWSIEKIREGHGLPSATLTTVKANTKIAPALEPRSIAQRLCEGDVAALTALRTSIDSLYRDLDPQKDQDRLVSNFKMGCEAFNLLGEKAAQGSQAAFDALKACVDDHSNSNVKGFAVIGMGVAAAAGHKEALTILIKPDDHKILLSEAVGALTGSASANIETAVDFLINVLGDPQARPLYSMASQALSDAALKGNLKAKAALGKNALERPNALLIGSKAPPLSAGIWLQGEPVATCENGKAYLVEFWATWCGPCVASIPHLNEIHLKYRDKGLVVIGQNITENEPDQVKEFIAKMGSKMAYRVALDDFSKQERGAMAADWFDAAGGGGIPMAFLVGTDGRIVWIGHPMDLENSQIEAALRAK